MSFLRGRKGMEEEGRGTFGSERRERIILDEKEGERRGGDVEGAFFVQKGGKGSFLRGRKGRREREGEGSSFMGRGKGHFCGERREDGGRGAFFVGRGRERSFLSG